MPSNLQLADNNQCFINQYVVDTDEQTSGFEKYSLTYAGADLKGLDSPDGAIPGGFWTHHFNSNADMRAYAAKVGVPASAGETTLEIADGILTATTSSDGVAVIRSTVRAGDEIAVTGRGQLRYITELDGQQITGNHPFTAGLVQPWDVLKFEFLEPGHPVSALRPADRSRSPGASMRPTPRSHTPVARRRSPRSPTITRPPCRPVGAGHEPEGVPRKGPPDLNGAAVRAPATVGVIARNGMRTPATVPARRSLWWG